MANYSICLCFKLKAVFSMPPGFVLISWWLFSNQLLQWPWPLQSDRASYPFNVLEHFPLCFLVESMVFNIPSQLMASLAMSSGAPYSETLLLILHFSRMFSMYSLGALSCAVIPGTESNSVVLDLSKFQFRWASPFLVVILLKMQIWKMTCTFYNIFQYAHIL